MIPDYQAVMLPLLHLISDGQLHQNLAVIDQLSKHFNLTSEEKNALLPSKRNTVMNNRIHWAKAHLKMAGLIETVEKGIFRLTHSGKLILEKNPSVVNAKYLMENSPIYRDKILSFRNKKKETGTAVFVQDNDNTQTPEELIENGYLEIRKALEEDIIGKLKTVHPAFFERIVVELLVKMGYGGSIAEAGRATKYSNDEGIDGIIKEDKLGLDVIYIQAKRWEGVVSRPEIQKFVGALAGQRAKKGVFITTSTFSKDAMIYAAQMDTKIVLIDGEQLAQYMIDYNLGVSIQNTYEIKKLDSDYFDAE